MCRIGSASYSRDNCTAWGGDKLSVAIEDGSDTGGSGAGGCAGDSGYNELNAWGGDPRGSGGVDVVRGAADRSAIVVQVQGDLLPAIGLEPSDIRR
jgi:hypothetical protein